jgi:hypothetical protein
MPLEAILDDRDMEVDDYNDVPKDWEDYGWYVAIQTPCLAGDDAIICVRERDVVVLFDEWASTWPRGGATIKAAVETAAIDPRAMNDDADEANA